MPQGQVTKIAEVYKYLFNLETSLAEAEAAREELRDGRTDLLYVEIPREDESADKFGILS